MANLENNKKPAKKTWFKPQIVLINQSGVGGGPNAYLHEGNLVTFSHKGTAFYFHTPGGATKTGINHTRHYYHS